MLITLETDRAKVIAFGRSETYKILNELSSQEGIKENAAFLRLRDNFLEYFENRDYKREKFFFIITKELATLLQEEHPCAQLYILSGVLEGVKGNSHKESTCYTSAIKCDPKYGRAYYYRAKVNTWRRDYIAPLHYSYYELINDCNRAIDADYCNATIYSTRAGLKERMGDIEGGLEDYVEALKFDDVDIEIYASMIALQKRLEGKRGSIKNHSDTNAVDISAGDCFYYYMRGQSLYFQEAGTHLNSTNSLKDIIKGYSLNPRVMLDLVLKDTPMLKAQVEKISPCLRSSFFQKKFLCFISTLVGVERRVKVDERMGVKGKRRIWRKPPQQLLMKSLVLASNLVSL